MAKKPTTKMSFTTGELARIFNVTDETIRNWIKRGIIAVTKLPSGRNQIDRHTVLALMRKYNIPDDRLKEAPRIKILLADKEESLRTLIEKYFEGKRHYEIKTARNAFEAGVITKEFRPDIILLDIFFETDVRDICSHVKNDQDTKNTKVVAISGQFTDQMKQTWRSYGFDNFLVKPFTLEDVLKCVEDALEASPKETVS